MLKLVIAFLAGFFLLLGLVPLAVDQRTYVNARFSYGIRVPSGYHVHAVAENGDGQTMVSADGTATLAICGSYITEGTFQSGNMDRIGWEKNKGWSVSYQRVQPRWASYSGSKAGRIFYTRSIPVCDGPQAAYFRIEYEKSDQRVLEPIIKDLVASLHPTEGLQLRNDPDRFAFRPCLRQVETARLSRAVALPEGTRSRPAEAGRAETSSCQAANRKTMASANRMDARFK